MMNSRVKERVDYFISQGRYRRAYECLDNNSEGMSEDTYADLYDQIEFAEYEYRDNKESEDY